MSFFKYFIFWIAIRFFSAEVIGGRDGSLSLGMLAGDALENLDTGGRAGDGLEAGDRLENLDGLENVDTW